MIERLVILVIVSAAGYAAWKLFQCWQVRCAALSAPVDPLLEARRPDVPAIVYFTSPMCVPCKTQQRPAIQQLLAELGDSVQVIEVDASEQPDAANRWGVMSVPTTFILDRHGQPREINNGITGPDKLKRQLMGL